jgi:hypothetical protein
LNVNALAFIIVGIILVVVAYFAPLPPPAKLIFNIIGWCALLIGVVLLVFGLLSIR